MRGGEILFHALTLLLCMSYVYRPSIFLPDFMLLLRLVVCQVYLPTLRRFSLPAPPSQGDGWQAQQASPTRPSGGLCRTNLLGVFGVYMYLHVHALGMYSVLSPFLSMVLLVMCLTGSASYGVRSPCFRLTDFGDILPYSAPFLTSLFSSPLG